MPKNAGKSYTSKDKKTVRRLARDVNVSTEEIAKELDRSVEGIRSFAQREGISLRPKNR